MGVISFRVIMIQTKNFLVVLLIVGYTHAQATATCGGAGATCKDASFNDLCICPAGTACAPAAGGPLAGSFCQYTFCLPDSMMCSGNIGTCCSGKCEIKAGETLATCAAATTTTTAAIIIDVGTTTTTASGVCSTINGPTPGAQCVFPFKFGGVTYTSCTTAGGFSQPWCSTRTDAYGNHMKGNYGDCNTSTCPSASSGVTTAAPVSTCSTPCKFPFIYQGVVHYACTYAGGFSPAWCSTATDAYGKHINGNFADCGVGCPVEISG